MECVVLCPMVDTYACELPVLYILLVKARVLQINSLKCKSLSLIVKLSGIGQSK